MLKKMLFALVPMMLIAVTVRAEENLLADISIGDVQDAAIAIEEPGLDADVDGLLASADSASGDDEAVEACFRSFGYRSYGYGGGYGYGYGHGYNCYRPCYSPCYSSYYVYRPVTYYHYCAPVYTNYWGCW
jgi:hypothetical protein